MKHLQMTPEFALKVLEIHPEWVGELVKKECGHGASLDEARGYFQGLIDAGMRLVPCPNCEVNRDGECLGQRGHAI